MKKVVLALLISAISSTVVAQECDGRRYCSQMHSCAEAEWFLENCPGMEMDGDGDGVPCERQFCDPSLDNSSRALDASNIQQYKTDFTAQKTLSEGY